MKTIVVINGASSSGRTSLVRRFCGTESGAMYQNLHIDEFTAELPPGQWRSWAGSDISWAAIGIAFNKHLKNLASSHTKVIADSFYNLPIAVNHLVTLFKDENLFFVQLYCELHELERREKKRGDRKIGLAKSQFNSVNSLSEYDLVLDSTGKSIDESVGELSMAIAAFEAQARRR